MDYKMNKDEMKMVGKPIRSQVPGDGVMQCNAPEGTMPQGGFRSMFRFGGSAEPNKSPTDKLGKKVY